MKVVCLLSGGIDSPVAAYVMAKAGAEVVLLHMDNRPYADDEHSTNVKKLAEKLREVTGQEMPLYFAPHGETQAQVKDKIDSLYQCVVCKHAMQLTAKKLCQNIGAVGIVMGDSLGQVASQTLLNIRTEAQGIDFPILRPLVGYDKIEIIDVANKIGTYDISSLPSKECTLVPKKVVTEGDIGKAEHYYKVSDVEELASACADKTVRVS